MSQSDLPVGQDEANQPSQDANSMVNPWSVADGVDYDFIVEQFGSQRISEQLIERIERIIGEPAHPWIKRGIFFSHRSLEELLDLYERGEPFYLYTGRGPSSEALHLGHMIPFTFSRWLQRVFNVPIVIQLTDDEKFYFKSYLTLEEASRLGFENIKDILACGFDLQKTFVFRNTDYIQYLYPAVCKFSRHITLNKVISTFGFGPSDHIGKYAFPPIQAAPSFSTCFPHIFKGNEKVHCLIPCAIDQDPYFRMTREIAPSLGWLKPALIHSSFFPALQGPNSKMSASDPTSSIYMTDTPQMISDKIKKYAFSGGGATQEEHRQNGGNCDIDVSFQYLKFFYFDDEDLERIRQEYTSGTMSTSELKTKLIQVLCKFVEGFQQNRASITPEIVQASMEIRNIEFP
jgi:tryptophanyl-tRNA synthetase